MPPGPARGALDDLRSQRVLVDAARCRRQPLEMSKRADEEPRLPHETFGAAIDRGAGLERAEGQALERGDVLPISTQRVVEAQDLGGQRRAQAKRRLIALAARRTTGHAKQRL